MGYGSQGTKKDREKSVKPNGTRARFNNTTFIQYELDKVASTACKAWNCDEVAAFHALHGLADAGYSVTLKYDTYSEAYASFMQQKGDEGPNSGFTLTGRGSTPYKALKQLLFKHFEVMAQTWEPFSGHEKASEIDD
jgi:hypothetical protein